MKLYFGPVNKVDKAIKIKFYKSKYKFRIIIIDEKSKFQTFEFLIRRLRCRLNLQDLHKSHLLMTLTDTTNF